MHTNTSILLCGVWGYPACYAVLIVREGIPFRFAGVILLLCIIFGYRELAPKGRLVTPSLLPTVCACGVGVCGAQRHRLELCRLGLRCVMLWCVLSPFSQAMDPPPPPCVVLPGLLVGWLLIFGWVCCWLVGWWRLHGWLGFVGWLGEVYVCLHMCCSMLCVAWIVSCMWRGVVAWCVCL